MMMFRSRTMRLAVLALCLLGMWGCAEDNEKNFAPTPGSAGAGGGIDGEKVSTPKKTADGLPVNE